MHELVDDRNFQKDIAEDPLLFHKKINFYLPHEFGGVGSPYFENDLYRLFNIYTPDMDLAIIKPRYTTKNEFKVDLPPNKYLDAQMEDNDDEASDDEEFDDDDVKADVVAESKTTPPGDDDLSGALDKLAL